MLEILNLLTNKLQETIYDLNMGKTLSTCDMQEMWTMLHHLHYANYDINSGDLLNQLLGYYE